MSASEEQLAEVYAIIGELHDLTTRLHESMDSVVATFEREQTDDLHQ